MTPYEVQMNWPFIKCMTFRARTSDEMVGGERPFSEKLNSKRMLTCTASYTLVTSLVEWQKMKTTTMEERRAAMVESLRCDEEMRLCRAVLLEKKLLFSRPAVRYF